MVLTVGCCFGDKAVETFLNLPRPQCLRMDGWTDQSSQRLLSLRCNVLQTFTHDPRKLLPVPAPDPGLAGPVV